MHQPFPDPTDDGSPQDHVTRPTSGPWPRPYTERHRMPPLLPSSVTPPRLRTAPEPYAPSGDPVDVCGPEAAARLDALRARRDAGGYPDDTAAHLNAHRLTFARYLVERGRLSEETGTADNDH